MSLNQNANKITVLSSFLVRKLSTLFFWVLLIVFNSPSFANSVLKEVRIPQYLPLEAQWCLPMGDCLFLEVADTSEEKRIGLMNRPSLSQGTGMLFQFRPAQIVRFWMQNMLIPIDMVFISEGLVIAIERNLKACSLSYCSKYGPNLLVDGVIELGAGEVKRLGVEVGDLVEIKYELIQSFDKE